MNNLENIPSHLTSSLYVGFIGGLGFSRKCAQALRNISNAPEHFVAQLADGWHKTLEQKPNLIIIESPQTTNRITLGITKDLIVNIRKRFGRDITLIVALNGTQQLLFAGELLFESEKKNKPSELIDFFITLPSKIYSEQMSFSDLLTRIFEITGRDIDRIQKGGLPLPLLNSDGWANSMGDIRSLELWRTWLPRYALYLEENPIIIGRTGTGKTNLAKALHLLSGRKGDFISMTPRDFSSSELVQAELFGAVDGAYTGAVDKWGLVKSAEDGTLFFDEFQSIDLDLQGKLITFIENKSYRRVGSPKHIQADVRFVFASNRKLFELVSEGLVREDFAYRLERVMLDLQSLEARRYDIAPALSYGLAKLHRQREIRRPITGFTNSAFSKILRIALPGNLRQLENIVAKCCERADIDDKQLIDDSIIDQVIKTSYTASHKDGVNSDILLNNQIKEALLMVETTDDLSFPEAMNSLQHSVNALENNSVNKPRETE